MEDENEKQGNEKEFQIKIDVEIIVGNQSYSGFQLDIGILWRG